ncbi:hypothetical protein DLAC_04719 [Tieghemostelium lacteum]|uniref:GRIP domain-containing protein n=1 Tax=Tieghemostelium lacteum TaxID=361077 RepID=A0A151ZKC5_TIELA|nr:hypothetical protein DLAC_04719 [Tieghemostelium lacteum]|eukprot:KYQ94423.1 hypothetical protein DLAC_04719 [Tieghemostelium lacteum]
MSTPTTPTKSHNDSGSHSNINVETSTREELIELVKKYYLMGKKMETRLQEAIEAYKKSKKESMELTKRLQNAEEESQLHKTTSNSIIQSLQMEIQQLNSNSQTLTLLKDQVEENLSKQFQQEKLIYNDERVRLNDRIQKLELDIENQQKQYTAELNKLREQQVEVKEKIEILEDNDIIDSKDSGSDGTKTYEYIHSLPLNSQMNLIMEENDSQIESLLEINGHKSSVVIDSTLYANDTSVEDSGRLKELQVENKTLFEKFNIEKENALVFLNQQKCEIETLFNDFKSEFKLALEQLEIEKDQQVKDINNTFKEETNQLNDQISQLKQTIVEKDNALDVMATDNSSKIESLCRDISSWEQAMAQKVDEINQLKSTISSTTSTPVSNVEEQQQQQQQQQKEYEEKEKKLKALLYGAQKHVTEQKKQIQERLAEVAEKNNEIVEKNNEIIILKGLIENLKTKQNETDEMSNDYQELKHSYDYNVQRLKLVEGQLNSTTKDLRSLQNEYEQYKIKAYHTINKSQKEDDEKDEEEDIENNLTTYIQNNENEIKLQEQTELNQSLNNKVQSLQESLDSQHSHNQEKVNKLQSQQEELKDKIKILKSKNQQLTESFNKYKLEYNSNSNNNNSSTNTIEQQQIIDNSEEIFVLKDKYEQELKNKDESIVELTSQLNLFKRNNNSVMREKDKEIQNLKSTISTLTEELELQSSPIPTVTNLKKSNNMINFDYNPTSNNFINNTTTTSNNNSEINNSENTSTEDLKKFNIEHLLPSHSLVERDIKSNLIKPTSVGGDLQEQALPLEVQDLLKHYAQLQASRDEELRKANQHISQLSYLLADSEKMDERHQEQEKLLKDEIRKLERSSKRDSVVPEYAKNIILKFIETDDGDSLLPVLSTIMQFTPEESKRAIDALKARKSSTLSPWRVKLF